MLGWANLRMPVLGALAGHIQKAPGCSVRTDALRASFDPGSWEHNPMTPNRIRAMAYMVSKVAAATWAVANSTASFFACP